VCSGLAVLFQLRDAPKWNLCKREVQHHTSMFNVLFADVGVHAMVNCLDMSSIATCTGVEVIFDDQFHLIRELYLNLCCLFSWIVCHRSISKTH
jgi:hypothetical protein